MSKITSEQLEVVIYSLSRPNGGGVDKFVKDHAVELSVLLEEYVLPELKKKEALALLPVRPHHYADEEYIDAHYEKEHLWDGFDD